MAEASFGSSSPVGSLSSEDHDFDPTAEMLIHEYDDERTLEEEELLNEEKNFSAELADLEREGNMPIEELLAMYRYEASDSTGAGSSIDSSSVELADDLPDMTLDKEEIAKDLLSGDYEEETQSSADDLTPSVTSHEATDFFPRTLRSNVTYDGDKESEGEDDGVSSEDSRKEIMVGSQYQAEVPEGLSHYNDDEKVYEEEDELLWCPGVLSECKVRNYLREAMSQTTDGNMDDYTSDHIQDNEEALFELLKCDYDTCEALTRHRRNVRMSKEESPPWSEDECRNFEHALQIYEKNFHLIQRHKVQTRTVAECVAFYYMWKKSERFDDFAQQNRFGKKKYSSYPGVTDLMDRLVDEAEGLAMDSSSSVCLGGARIEGSAEQQLGLLNSITASDLTALSNSVATVCNGPADVSCLDTSYFSPLESLHRGSLNHDEQMSYVTTNGDGSCFNMLDSAFYRSDLSQMSVCGTKDCERPSKRLKMGLAESFINDVSVSNLAMDFEGRRTHRITGTTMAVSVTDFSSIGGSDPNGFISAHSRHHQHTALQSD
ncbi:mesoderm induction early response protein 3 isoform X1 [Misgurnus anguillicaudatus]|uniref:mesoderm induction early response protein 3 isoform X1 n=2 Tax=Misgurnus anguillicaudatus TaxID=75329 RepID=UPI002435F1B5|nr:mesoderm induction early response protein 3 isoform X1 [Misgurnus anguillicaudatus]